MNWRLKSAAFRVLSHLPFRSSLHFAVQRHVTRNLPRKPALLDAYWAKAEQFVELYRARGSTDLASATFLEIGAGRDLSFALSLRLLGVGRVVPVDIERLAKLDLIKHAAEHLCRKAGVPIPDLESWDDLEAFGIAYTAPATTHAVNEPIDCICSSEVLEHIDAPALQDFAADSLRLLAPGGLAVHSIDYSDHFARGDGSIDRFNFLQYDEDGWRPHNSSMHYVNRLRPVDYRRIFEDAGWRILEETQREGILTVTRRERIAPQFRSYAEEDLLALNGRLILTSAAGGSDGAEHLTA